MAVLIDSSDANMGFGRAIELQDSLLVTNPLFQWINNNPIELIFNLKEFNKRAIGT